jgi:uncharacterized membrane protein
MRYFASYITMIVVMAALDFLWIGFLAKQLYQSSLLTAAIFGFCAYATYDLTNLATLKNWPISVALTDMAWGTFASIAAVAFGKTVFDELTAG